MVSGTSAYRRGEFLYQDYLYDDHGARETPDPADPKAAGNLFSKPNGTYTYPTSPRYANNAADLVEFRVKPLRRSTAFRVTLNTLKDPSLVAFSIAIGGRRGKSHPFPDGANVKAPARLFLTVHPRGGDLVANLTHAAGGKPVGGPGPGVHVSKRRRQIVVRVPHRSWNPHRRTVRFAAGVGLWDASSHRYLLPGQTADATHPGGAGTDSSPAAFFNVAFRKHEPVPKPTESNKVLTDAAWWRDRDQGAVLADGDISRLHAHVDFGKLRRRVTDNSSVPRHGPMDRILASHFETAQGANFSESCLSQAATCRGQYLGRLQPYAIYVPKGHRPAQGYGMTLLLHSLSANYNQYLGTRNQSQFGERGPGSIVITPESRGPDENYENYGAADVFEVWADVARRYHLNPGWTSISGYSMGGVGTLKLGSQFPDLFARAQPTVGFETNNDVLASLRNIPVLMWNNHGDELADEALFTATADKLDSLGYRYELDAFQPCANPNCSPLFPNHLQLAVNDQYAPAAAFLGTARVHRNPAHVTYVLDAARNHKNLGLVGNHAYWIGGLRLRDPSQTGPTGDPEGDVNARSLGFGRGDPAASHTRVGAGQLKGGNLGTLIFTRQFRTWGKAPRIAQRDEIDINATNIAAATVNVHRAHVDCHAQVKVQADGPMSINLGGCDRTIHAG
jgi:predicted esterase